MRTSVSVPLAALGAALLLLIGARPALSAPWQWPVAPGSGHLIHAYRFDARSPFAKGRRRGIDLGAAPGARVRAVCRGRVAHAGPVPLRGLGVSIRCGEITATELGLRALAVHRGATVSAGTFVGAVGSQGVLRLGARVTSRRFGYLDPLALLPGAPAVHGSPPLGAAPRSPHPIAPLTRTRVHRPRPVGVVQRPFAARAAAPHLPPLAWAGIALVAAAIPLGGLAYRRTRRRAATAALATEAPPRP